MDTVRIMVDGVETVVSLGIDDARIEKEEIDEDTIRLDEVVKNVKEILDEQASAD